MAETEPLYRMPATRRGTYGNGPNAMFGSGFLGSGGGLGMEASRSGARKLYAGGFCGSKIRKETNGSLRAFVAGAPFLTGAGFPVALLAPPGAVPPMAEGAPPTGTGAPP